MDKTEKLIDWEANEKQDRNHNGIDDAIEPPIPDVRAGSAKLAERLREDGSADLIVTGGDLDANWANAQFSGDESVVSSSAAPDGGVDEMGQAMGITYAADEVLKVGEKERSRDKNRWELDPASSEDYIDRVREDGDRKS